MTKPGLKEELQTLLKRFPIAEKELDRFLSGEIVSAEGDKVAELEKKWNEWAVANFVLRDTPARRPAKKSNNKTPAKTKGKKQVR